MKKGTWHGLYFEQCLTMWDAASWRAEIEHMLRDVIVNRATTIRDRLIALQTLNEAVANKIFDNDAERLRFIRDALLAHVSGSARRPPLFFRRRRARRLRHRLMCARWMLQIGYQLKGNADAEKQLAEAADKPTSTLLS